MPFDVADHQWANERFADHDLRARNRFSLTDPAGNHLRVGDHHYVGERSSWDASRAAWTGGPSLEMPSPTAATMRSMQAKPRFSGTSAPAF